jgi:hypothetical protein
MGWTFVEMPRRPHGHYPQVELPESDFQEMLDLVDALDPQQLLRLYCKVGSKIGPYVETIPGALEGRTDQTGVFELPSYMPPALEAPEGEGGGEDVYIELDLDDLEK